MYASNYLKEGPMSHRRFEQILRNLHTVDTAALSETELAVKKNENPFFQVEDFLNALAKRFQSLYDLGQLIDIDEMCITFKGRHIARCYNGSKPNKFHFKAFCLNDARTGYLCIFFMYKGMIMSLYLLCFV
jgi:hypothetical protein